MIITTTTTITGIGLLLHCMLSLAAQCIVIGPVCGCVFVCGSVTMITRNCVHQSSPNWVRVRPWEGAFDGAKFFGSTLLQPVRSVCISLSAFFHFISISRPPKENHCRNLHGPNAQVWQPNQQCKSIAGKQEQEHQQQQQQHQQQLVNYDMPHYDNNNSK